MIMSDHKNRIYGRSEGILTYVQSYQYLDVNSLGYKWVSWFPRSVRKEDEHIHKKYLGCPDEI